MTWEITVGLLTLVTALIAIMNVVVRVNRALTALELSVKSLDESIQGQADINKKIVHNLSRHEKRLTALEFAEGETFSRPRAVNDLEAALCDLPLVEHRCFGKEAD